MKSYEIVMQQSEILAQLNEASMNAAIKHDREMKIYGFIGIALRVAFVISVAMAVSPKLFC